MKKIFFVFILIPFLLLTSLITVSNGQDVIRTVTGTVIKISDGDTIHLETPEKTILKVRLYGIDAPETDKINNLTGMVSIPGQPYGEESKNALANKIKDKNVKMDILDIDKYQRMVGMIYLGERNINLEMVKEGYAEAFIEYLKEPYKKVFLEAEREARSAKKGIWSLSQYERPRDFRKRLKVRGAE